MTLSNKKEGQVIKTMALLDVKNVKKIYTTRFGGNQVEALHNVSFSVEAGEYVAIMGESGSGKTTLLNILAALDKPTGGKVYLKGNDLGKIREKEMAAFRRQNLGFVFQDFNLLDTLTLKVIFSFRWSCLERNTRKWRAGSRQSQSNWGSVSF